MMTERQRKFREAYKADISPLYNGLLHITVMYGAGIVAISYCLGRIEGATWEWLLVAPVFIAGNFVEWFMHRYVMHRKIDVFALRAIYERHTRQHTSTSAIWSRRSTRRASSASCSSRGAC